MKKDSEDKKIETILETTPVTVEEEVVVIQNSSKKKIVISVKAIVIAVIVIVILVLAFIFKSLWVAATVDGHLIGRWTVIRELEKVSGKSALDALITQKLIENEAAKRGIEVSDDELKTEIEKIETQLKNQKTTLADALKEQNMSQTEFEKRVIIQKTMEKLVADKTGVTDAEIDQYIKDNEIKVPAGQEAEYQSQVKDQLQQQKFNNAATELVDTLRTQAQIKYFVKY